MASPKKPNPQETEKKLQIVFGIAVALVVLGLIAFFVLAMKDMQH